MKNRLRRLRDVIWNWFKACLTNLYNLLSWIWKLLRVYFKRIITFIFFMVAIYIAYRILGINEPNLKKWQAEQLGAFCTAIFAAIGGSWALFEYESGQIIRKQSESVNIAEKFKKELAASVSIIDYAVRLDSDLKYIVDKIPKNTMLTFASFELSEFIDKNERLLFIEIINMTFDEIVDKAVNNKLNRKEKQDIKKNFKKAKVMYNGNLKDTTLANIMIETLNGFESISMNIASKAADPDKSYKVLHKTFLSSIRILSILICHRNANSTDRLFPNISHVYNKWVVRRAKEYKREKARYIKNGSIRTV